MLVLTRKLQDRIIIGQDVEIVVLSISGQRVKLGIKASADQRILRSQPSSAEDKNFAELEAAACL